MNDPYDQMIARDHDPWLIDEVFSEYEFKGQRSITIHADPAQIFSAIRAVTLADMPVAAALIWLRYLPGRLSGVVQSQTSEMNLALGETLKRMVVLAEKPDQEMVLGAIKSVIDVRLAGDTPEAGYRFTIDHRLHALSEKSRRQFARYWLVIGPASWFMLGILLGAIKRRAERESAQAALPKAKAIT